MTWDLSTLYTADETDLVARLAAGIGLCAIDRDRAKAQAGDWVETVRSQPGKMGMIDAFLQEYGLSTEEGVILMRLSEALIRTPDFATAQELMRDKLSAGAWQAHDGSSPATMVNAATIGLRVSAAWIKATGGKGAAKLAARLGDRVLHGAVVQGMGIMARHFVLGHSIADATHRANQLEAGKGLYSFDMLGEGALTQKDAQRYFDAYKQAIEHLATLTDAQDTIATANGLSVKLSALYPRYEYAKRGKCVPFLVGRMCELAQIAKRADVGLTIDAEEAHRLELSLEIFDHIMAEPSLAGWDGLGIVVQAYQRRATGVIDHVVRSARAAGRKITVRLVKGAYWDSEIKRAQEMGLDNYPVFTRKEHTDISYLACARKLLSAGDLVFPQFATHNAHTAASIIQMAGENHAFEFQRLHGMGEALHHLIGRQTRCRTRIYAPVGSHKELLPYLVRRLLENGANSSFVNQLMNPDIDVDEIIADPLDLVLAHGYSPNPAIPAPRAHLGPGRLSARGIDLTQSRVARHIGELAQSLVQNIAVPHSTDPSELARAIERARQSDWPNMIVTDRAQCLQRAADIMEARMHGLMSLCVHEAFKTWPDGVAEVREAVDFCRYYGDQAVAPNMRDRAPLGVVACISPWNFPLAIFIGQVGASLVAGNTVIAKPAPQTPHIAQAAVDILYEAGVPRDALHLVFGEGDMGAALVGNASIDGVCFTGSTQTAQRIAQARAQAGRADSVLIAETGGINAMIVDSTALLEQAVNAVVASAFQSAGQRCSACRLVCVQDDIGDAFDEMLQGAMAQLVLGPPQDLATDVGPLIDANAHAKVRAYVEAARQRFPVIGQAPDLKIAGHFLPPVAFAISSIGDVREEIFGPVLHVLRFKAAAANTLLDDINALGYGLTLGVHSRIDARVQDIARRAHVGNVYVNRNQIGAVVGVQPFGGEGLSGTGPKAGGPHYLLRLSRRSRQAHIIRDNHPPPQVKAQEVGRLNELAIALGDQNFVSDKYAQRFAAKAQKIDLPGPTGEENTLSLVPRGHILCCGGDAPETVTRQVLMALASGNTAIVARANASPDLMAQAGGSVSFVSDGEVCGLLKGAIDGAMADGAIRENVAETMAGRQGALIPLLSIDDDFYRFFHERTVSIDTTAAGGNASLLGMGSQMTATAVQ